MHALKLITSRAILWSSDKVPSHAIGFCCPRSETYLESHFCHQKNTILKTNSLSTEYHTILQFFTVHWNSGRQHCVLKTLLKTLLLFMVVDIKLGSLSNLHYFCSAVKATFMLSFVAYTSVLGILPASLQEVYQVHHCGSFADVSVVYNNYPVAQVKYQGFLCLWWLQFLFNSYTLLELDLATHYNKTWHFKDEQRKDRLWRDFMVENLNLPCLAMSFFFTPT